MDRKKQLNPLLDAIAVRARANVAQSFATSAGRATGARLRLRAHRAQGVEFPADIALRLVATEGGESVFVSATDASDLTPKQGVQ